MSTVTVTLNETAYVTIAAASREVERSQVTLFRWAEAGAVRDLYRVFGRKRHHLVALEDCQSLAEMTSAESLALGISRASDRVKRYCERYRAMMQERTRPTAEHHGELYDDYDIDKILATLDTLTVEEQAKVLGRTYAAMCSERSKVRRTEEVAAGGDR